MGNSSQQIFVGHLLSPGTGQGAGNIAVNKTGVLSQGLEVSRELVWLVFCVREKSRYSCLIEWKPTRGTDVQAETWVVS